MLTPALPTLPQLATPKPSQDTSSHSADSGDAFAQVLNQQSNSQDSNSSKASDNSNSNDDSQTRQDQSQSQNKEAQSTHKDDSSTKTSKSTDKSTKKADAKSDKKDAGKADDGSTTTTATATGTPVAVDPNAPVIVPVTPVPVALPLVPVAATSTAPTAAPAPTVAAVTPNGAPVDLTISDPKANITANTKLADATTATASPLPAQTPATDTTATAAGVLTQTIAQAVATDVAAKTSGLALDAKTITTDATAAALKDVAATTAANLATSLQTSNPITTALTGTTATSTPAPSAPYSQVVAVVLPLRTQGDGDYNMTLQLHPADMGKVEVAISLHNGEISMQLSADNPDSRQLLRDSMTDLRNELNASGLQTGSLDVGAGDTKDQQQASAQARANNSSATDGDEMDDSDFFSRLATVTSNRTSDGSLDVRV